MKKIKVLITDDEKLAREIIKNYLGKDERFEIIGECQNGYEALKFLADTKPDIMFLDVQMPKINGFELLELIEDPPPIIFSTAFDDFALKAFEVNAVDYLLKPYSLDRFNEALEKVLLRIEYQHSDSTNITKLVNTVDQNSDSLDRIVVKKGSDIHIIATEKIYYIEAQDDYVNIKTAEGSYLKQKTLKHYEEKLSDEVFIRSHRSYMVNLNFISKIEPLTKDTHVVILKDGSKVPVSRTGYQKLKDLLE